MKTARILPALTLVAVLSGQPSYGEDQCKRVVRLFRQDRTFSTELPAKIDSNGNSENCRFTLRSARLEADSMGFLTRLRSVLTITNNDATRRITEVQWRLDVFDEALNSLSQRVLQEDKVNIYTGETAAASARFGAVLPDRMIVLFQLTRVSFDDGSKWSPTEECSPGKNLQSVSCKPT
ncbi:MAG: hypothetical protein WAV20_00515 [Blastocatellia bacterium]